MQLKRNLMLKKINKIFYDNSCAVGLRMSKKYIEEGDYFPEHAWGCEGQIYPALTGTAILNLHKKSKNKIFLDGTYHILKSIIKKQLPTGGWPLSLGLTANGIRFKVSDEIKNLTSKSEDLPPTVTSLRLIADYIILTGDNSFYNSLKIGFNYLTKFWDEQNGNFKEMLTGDALKLRASPKDYNIYTFLCFDSLKNLIPEAESYLRPLYYSVKKNFELMNADTYPLLYGMHAALISKVEGPSSYVKSIVKKRIDGELGLKSRFIINDCPGAIGHHDGLRGICLDEGHLRNSIGIALAMRFYDFYVEDKTYTNSKLYKDILLWINSMYFESKYYEFIDLNTNKKYGFGSAGQFLPIYLTLRAF